MAFSRRMEDYLPAAALGFLAAGAFARGLTGPDVAHIVWMVGLLGTGAPVVRATLRGMLSGRFAADVIAMLAVVTAFALAQPLAGLVIVLMQTGGESLERWAGRRASNAVRELEKAAPRIAHRVVEGEIEDVPAERVSVDDLLLVRPGEFVPCDGVVVLGRSHVDASRLTGEPLPVSARAGSALLSGSLNQESPLQVRATRISSESQYARIVELVRTAQASKAPLQRIADRYAVWFTPLTIVVCALTWLLSGDAVRVLAVLVVATPCPLLLATPVAIIGGIDHAARRHIVLRDGGALERLADVTVVVFDKTGTLTEGMPTVARVTTSGSLDERDVLRLAAAVETGSGHLLARTLVDAAREAGLEIAPSTDVVEAPGQGVTGLVEGRRIAVGSPRFIATLLDPSAVRGIEDAAAGDAGLDAFVAVDGRTVGVVRYQDRIRPGARDLLERLRALGIRRTIVLSGDQTRNVSAIGLELGIADVRGDLLPEEKVEAVNALVAGGDSVAMVGDGTNDAPALSAATVGIALAGHGGGITAEAADIVLLIDEPAAVATAIEISRRTMRIARQSLRIGLGLSGIAMIFATLGYVAPAVGALLQEAIDIGVILNALRTTLTGPDASMPSAGVARRSPWQGPAEAHAASR